MRVFIAGATGAIGRPLVRKLVAAGHDVTGMTRSESGAETLRSQGASAVLADALDAESVRKAVAEVRPDVIVHQLTALKGADFRKLAQSLELTNRLRREGTDNLLAAAHETGVRRIVAQSFGGWNIARGGSPVKTEDVPLDRDPIPATRPAAEAIEYLEERVLAEPEGLVLRYGYFYGPGGHIAKGGEMVEAMRRRKLPVVGDGGAVWSFVHTDDAADATVRAIEGGRPGLYQVADDDPAPVNTWLPELARVLGAPAPRRIPAWLGRLVAGEVVVSMFTQARGMDNAKAKRDLGWQPAYASWREGFRHGL